MPTTILVSFDIEKAGALPLAHPVVAIGLCVGQEDGTILEKRRMTFAVKWGPTTTGGDFEPRCWDEFWSKQPKALVQLLQTDTEEVAAGMTQFGQWLDALEDIYPSPDFKIKFLSDNPSFDIAALDLLLEQHCHRRPLRYSRDGRYRSVHDPSEMIDVFPSEAVEREIREFIAPRVTHDHDPANDAEHILLLYVLVQRLKSRYFSQ